MAETKIIILLGLCFIIFLAVLILTSRVLYDINRSSSLSDPRIINAKKWTSWGVGISAAGTALSLIGLIVIIAV